ncbi:helix-turn-helix transcriptional regulator [Pseudomonas sp. R2.Fl]|nr:helix-turn-helix transcriptional regulator [Pseudomonas sp. R2.Fl]
MARDIVDDIYEAALVGELWPDVLDAVRAETRSLVGLIIGVDPAGAITALTSPGGESILADYQSLDLFSRSQRLPRIIASNVHDFVTDDAIFTPQEKAADPAYTEFLFPRGMGHGAGTIFRLPDGSTILVDLERTLETGPYDDAAIGRLNALRPHFGRAATLLHKAELQRARDRVDALAALGIAAMALDGSGRPLALNREMEALVPSLVADRSTGVVFTDPAVDRLWQELIGGGGRVSASIPIRRGADTFVAHLVPVVRRAQDIFSRTASLLLVTPVGTASQALPADVIQVLFDLTPAEARVAYRLAGGATVTRIAAGQKVTEETIRSHVKAILRKTALSRQADLVSLFSARLPVKGV